MKNIDEELALMRRKDRRMTRWIVFLLAVIMLLGGLLALTFTCLF